MKNPVFRVRGSSRSDTVLRTCKWPLPNTFSFQDIFNRFELSAKVLFSFYLLVMALKKKSAALRSTKRLKFNHHHYGTAWSRLSSCPSSLVLCRSSAALSTTFYLQKCHLANLLQVNPCTRMGFPSRSKWTPVNCMDLGKQSRCIQAWTCWGDL